MKKLLASLLLTLSLAVPAYAQTNLSQGGTGWSTSTVGDLFVGTSSFLRYSRLPVGASGTVLQASSTSPFRMAWVTLSSIFSDLLASNNNWTGTNTFSATTTLSNVQAGGSGGMQFFSNGGTQVANFGAGGGSNALFLGGVNVTGDLAVDTDILYVDTTNNRVGIGTTSPRTLLDITSSNPIFTLTDTDGGYNQISGNGAFTLMADVGNTQPGSRFAFEIDGTEYMRLNTTGGLSLGSSYVSTNPGAGNMIMSGSLGIGTSTPERALDVRGQSQFIDKSGTNNRAIIIGRSVLDAASKSTAIVGRSWLNANAPFTIIGSAVDDASNAYVNIGGAFSNNNAATGIRFYTAASTTTLNGTERMRIDASGNVGIGTTTASALLTVSSSTMALTSSLFSVASTTEIFRVNANGRVAINHGSPQATLHVETPVQNSTNVTAQYLINRGSGSGIGTRILMGYNTTAAASGGISSYYSTTGNTGMKTGLEAGGVTFLTGDLLGLVGVGTTSPSAKFTIQGTSGSTTPLFSVASSSGTVAPILQVIPVATLGGFVGINAPTPTYQLEVSTDSNSAGRGILVGQHTEDTGAAALTFQKSRGSRVSPANVANGDYSAAFIAQNYEGGTYRSNGSFGYRVNGAVATNNIPGQWFFAAATSSDTNPYTNGNVVMVIDSNKRVGIGTTTPYTTFAVTSTSSSEKIVSFTSVLGEMFSFFSSGKSLFATSTAATCGNAECGLTVGTTTQFTAGVVSRVVGYSSAASTTINLNTTDAATTTIDRATTFVNPTGTAYDVSMFQIIALATTTQTIYWGNMFASSSPLTLPSTIASGTNIYLFQYNKFTNKLLYTGFMGPFN